MMQIWKIDANNYFTGESYLTDNPTENEIAVPIIIGYLKPIWDGTKWAEASTEQEIIIWKEEQKNQPQPKTELELIREQTVINQGAIDFIIMNY